jgi:hypothetical protein
VPKSGSGNGTPPATGAGRKRQLAIAAAGAENPVSKSAIAESVNRGEALVRSGILALAIVAAACSSDSASPPPSDPTASAALLKKDCADPKWKEENLGLWYSVCRPPLRW